MAKDRSEINVKGGGLFQFRELISGGVATAFTTPAYLRSTNIQDDPEMVTSRDEVGDVINVQASNENAFVDVVLMQTSKTVIDYLRNSRGKYYEFYYQVKLANGKFQEWNAAPVKIIPKINLAFAAAERLLPLRIVFLKPKATYTRNPTNYNNNAADGPAYFILIENAAAVGVPADTDGAVYTSVV